MRLGTLWPASSAHPRCRERATCVPDLGHCERPAGRGGSSTVPDCGASSRGVRGSLAERITEGKKNFCCVTTRRRNLWIFNGLRRGLDSLAAQLSLPGRAGLWQGHPGDVWLAAAPPATGGPAAGIPDPGSSAGSSAGAGTCAHTLCVGKSAGTVGALWPNSHAFPYSDECPREVPLPREKLGEDVQPFSPSAIKTRTRRLLASLSSFREQDGELNGFRSALQKETPESRHLQWRSPHAREWR